MQNIPGRTIDRSKNVITTNYKCNKQKIFFEKMETFLQVNVVLYYVVLLEDILNKLRSYMTLLKLNRL